MEWKQDSRNHWRCDVGEIFLTVTGFCAWWFNGDKDIIVSPIDGFITLELAKAAVIEAEKKELQRRAEMIGCKVVDDDDVVIDKETYDELVERSMALGGHYKDVCDEQPAPAEKDEQ